MKELLHSVRSEEVAIESSTESISYKCLFDRVNELGIWLKAQNVSSVCIYAQNSIDWIIVDLACQQSEVVFTPIPLFFTDIQFNSLIPVSYTHLTLPTICSV